MIKPRVRFAPSPTGYLHIGGARTALFNWLYARHTGGTFILRIEDTDAARNSQEAVEVILSGLRWLGLDWDEGPIGKTEANKENKESSLPSLSSVKKIEIDKLPVPQSKGNYGPYFQSQRTEIYQRRVQELLSKGLAYEHEGAVKFRMTREPITIHDLVVGDVVRKLTDREEVDPDFVILRSDGQPVFHLVNVIDDLEMDITHVIRGEDHLSNTAKHIALFQAFGVKPPHYAHIPLILNGDGSKMSKRDTGASLTSYLDEGFLPEAVINYLCLLGWSPKDNREKLSRAEVIERFDLPQILRHNARFDYEKLLWLQGEYARELADDRFYELAVHAFAKAGMDTNKFPLAYVKAALDTCKGKFKLFSELPAYAGFYFRDEIIYNVDDAKKVFIPENKPRLEKLRDAFEKLSEYGSRTMSFDEFIAILHQGGETSRGDKFKLMDDGRLHILSPNNTNKDYFIKPETVKRYFEDIPTMSSEEFRYKYSAYFHNVYCSIIPSFEPMSLETALKETAKQLGVKAGVLIHPTRLAVTGNPHGPSLYHLLEVLGKEKSLARIERAIAHIT